MSGSLPRRVPWWAILAITLAAFGADLLTKEWALAELAGGGYVPVLGSVFGFQLIFNPGAAFSFATGATWVLTTIAVVVVAVIVRMALRLRSWWWALALALLLGGTLGNLYDRLFRDPGFGTGHVVDFLNYNGFFIGNVADIFIVVAAALIAILAFVGISYDGSDPGGKRGAGAGDLPGQDGAELETGGTEAAGRDDG